MKGKLTTEEFVEKARKVRGKYDYSKTIYENSHSKVAIICPVTENGEFRQIEKPLN